MECPHQFTFLHVHAYWPTFEETLSQEVGRVTPAGYGWKGAPSLPPRPPHHPPPSVQELVDTLTPPGILQICLRLTPLFADCGETDIQDLHVDPHVRQPCQNQPLLVEELAEMVWSYEYESLLYERLPHTIQQSLRAHLAYQQDLLTTYELLRRMRALPDQAPSVSQAERAQSYTTMHQVVQTLQNVSPDTWHWYARRRTPQAQRLLRLCVRMRSTLQQFGPRAWYPAAALLNAIVHVLLAFSIEKGSEDTVAKRVRQRLYRFDHPQHPRPRA